MSNEYTLLCVADPQSQNVQENGHPRFVSHSAIHFWSGFLAIKVSKVPDRYGDGTSDRVSIRIAFGVVINVWLCQLKLMPGITE